MIAVAIRIVALLWFIPTLVPEFEWMLLGEKLSEGLLLYRDVEDHTAILSGGFFWLMHELFGRSHIANQLVTLVLIAGQAILLNLLANKNDLLKDHSYVPGLLYVILASAYLDFFVLSPVLLGLTFALFAFNRFFQSLKTGSTDDLSFKIGINLGIAMLFYKPFVLLLVLMLIDLLLYSNTVFKRYVIILFSFAFPTLMLMSYYYWYGSLDAFITHFFIASFTVSSKVYLDWSSLTTILIIPLSISLLGFFNMLKGIGYINYQTKCHYVLFHWLVIGSIGAFFATELSTFSFLYILPSLVLFSSAFFLDFKRKWLGELLFLVFVGAIITIPFSLNNPKWISSGLIDNTTLKLKGHNLPTEGKLLVLSDEVEYYQHNKIATTFINWRIDQEYFNNLDDYNNISFIYEKLNEDLPDVIIDPKNYCEKLFSFLPSIEEKYTKSGTMYIKKHN